MAPTQPRLTRPQPKRRRPNLSSSRSGGRSVATKASAAGVAAGAADAQAVEELEANHRRDLARFAADRDKRIERVRGGEPG